MMAIVVTNILNDARIGNFSYNAASDLGIGFVFFGRTHNYAGSTAAPTINGVAMTLLKSVNGTEDYYLYYAKIGATGSYTLADGTSFAKQIFHVSNVFHIKNSWSALSKTVAVAGSGAGIMISSVYSRGLNDGGYPVTPATGYIEVADDVSAGSGGDWGLGIEFSYKLAETGTSLVVTSSAGETSHIAVELIAGGQVICGEDG